MNACNIVRDNHNQEANEDKLTGGHKSSIISILGKIFSNPWNRTTIICMSCIQMGFNTFYYGVLSSLERTGSSFGLNVFLIGLH